VLVLETVMPDEQDGVNSDSAPIHLLDLVMLLNFGARERSLAEYTALLEAACFGRYDWPAGPAATWLCRCEAESASR
jgi:hypothetical protein